MEHDSANLERSVRRVDRFVSYVVSHAYVKTLVFLVAFIEGIFSPLPPEAVVAALLAYRKDLSWKIISLVSACGSALGLSSLYFLGRYAYSTHEAFLDKLIGFSRAGEVAQSVVTQNPLSGAFFSTFTPLVDRIFTLSAGIFSLPLLSVLVGLFFGRLLRVGVVAYFSHKFGSEARKYIVRHTKLAAFLGTLLILYMVLKALGIL